MAQFYFNPASHMMGPQSSFANGPAHHNHPPRSRRGGRFTHSSSVNSNKSMKNVRASREHHAAELAQVAALRKDYEAARSFDIDDDELFCPWHLLTEDDLHSIHTSSSDRSSSSGDGSPDSSPLQPQIHPSAHFALSATANPHVPSSVQQSSSGHLKLHQPLAQRTRNAIPIVDPNSRNASPPTSLSPARQQQQQHQQKAYTGRRW